MQNYVSGQRPRRRRFAVTVDGVRHEVIVEELDDVTKDAASGSSGAASSARFGSNAPPSHAQDQVSSNAVVDATPGHAAGAKSGQAAGDDALQDGWVEAPMPGTVTELAVKIGDEVKAGDVLLILTAMKLENEIPSPSAGIVKAIAVAPGDNVNNGDRLVQLDTGGKNE